MLTTTVDVNEFITRIREFLVLVEKGVEITVTQQDVPHARLVSLPAPTGPRTPALHPGAFQPAEDFDAPLPDEFWLGEP
jgi:antitoxin (DNA-binding transcriptional repressor) of toxin-antitoxin stability system